MKKLKKNTINEEMSFPPKYYDDLKKLGKDEFTEQSFPRTSPTSGGNNKPLKGGTSSQIPSELKDVEGIRKFQDWLDVNRAGWAKGYEGGILNKGISRGGYGKFGPRTIKAWNSYKNEYLKTSNSAETPSSGSTSNWQDAFPSCVKGLKGFYNPQSNSYFSGFGTDTEGVQYQINYFSQKFKAGQLCIIYNDGAFFDKGYYSCTTNNQQITIKTLSSLSITGSVINPDSKDIASSNQNDKELPSGDDTLDYDRVTKTIGI